MCELNATDEVVVAHKWWSRWSDAGTRDTEEAVGPGPISSATYLTTESEGKRNLKSLI